MPSFSNLDSCLATIFVQGHQSHFESDSDEEVKNFTILLLKKGVNIIDFTRRKFF